MVKDTSTEIIKRVAMYIRVSTEEQVEKYGFDLQKSAIEALIASRSRVDNKLEFAGKEHVYFDDGVTGTTPLNERPEFIRLQENLVNASSDNRPFDVVAVYKIDRFARKLSILLDTTKIFEENGVEFISVNESIDTSTPFGRAMLGIIGVIAELEIETTKQRTQGGREEAAKSGVVLGNSSIYGYKKDKEKRHKIFEEEAKIVRMIFGWFVNEKLNAGQIATRLKEMQVLSPEESALQHGKRKGKSKKKNSPFHWTPTAVLRILSDELYIGKYFYNKSQKGKPLSKDKWSLSLHSVPQIIDEVLFEKAQRLLEQNRHERKVTSKGNIYLLSGLLTCDCCYDAEADRNTGRRHWIATRKLLSNGKVTYSYNCNRKSVSKYDKICPTLPLPGKEIEDYVVDFSRNLLADPQAAFEYQNNLKSRQKGMEHLRKQEELCMKVLAGIDGRKRNVRIQHEHHLIGIKELTKKIEEINSSQISYNERLTDVRRQMAEYELSKGYLDTIDLFSRKYRKMLDDIKHNRAEAYNVIHNLIEEIIVYSRPVRKTDIIAGMKKANQQIPYRLHIKLKLPQDLLQELEGSGYKNIAGGR